MNQLITLSLEVGDLYSGFPAVTAHLWELNSSHPMKFLGGLPAAPEIPVLYHSWKLLYTALCQRLSYPPRLEVETAGVTHVSETDFDELCQRIVSQMNHWLKSPSFQTIDQQLRTHLHPTDEIRILIETQDYVLQRLPWHRWDFCEHYPHAEIALSASAYQRPIAHSAQPSMPRVTPKQIQVLAVLGNQADLNLQQDRVCLEQLSDQAAIEFLVEPQREQFYHRLWQGCDILFFAGHSASVSAPMISAELEASVAQVSPSTDAVEQGLIQLNDQVSLSLAELRNALKRAIAQGLKLAIFNSCDGLGLAHQLADLHIPQVIVMREPVPDAVAHEFLQYFLVAFADGQSLYRAVREARERLQSLEHQYPCATWLPMIYQNPAMPSIVWQNGSLLAESVVQHQGLEPPATPALKPIREPMGVQATLVPGANRPDVVIPGWRRSLPLLGQITLTTALVIGLRWFGVLQPLELQAFDHFMRQRPSERQDTRLLIVTIDEDDLQLPEQRQRQGSLSDVALTQLLKRLTASQPRAIGLDIFRDYPISPQNRELINQFRQDNVFAICQVSNLAENRVGVAAPPGIPLQRQGFSTILQDGDGILRRHLLGMEVNPSSPCTATYAFSIQLAMHYLKSQGITAQFTDEGNLQIGSVTFHRLRSHSGGYHNLDDWGYQILLHYRSHRSPLAIAPTVTLREVLAGKVQPDQIKDRIVLIGVTARSFQDYHSTPFSVGQEMFQAMPGVIVQAQMVSQIVSAVADGRPLLRSWPLTADAIWILGWSIIGGLIAGRWRSRPYLLLATSVTLAVLYVCCFGLFVMGYWVPLVPTLLALTLIGSNFVLQQHRNK
ncbi:MAG: CHASE2 domain-containing protein [Leptolyngbyaceae cyanobacterium bins.349]|nr:CHASE2 domain-containing protein [Leptolyngbyaceae cyanobacterium bins.349]